MSYDNSNRLALWFNDRREKQTQPHLRGQGEAGGYVWVSAWFSDEIADEDKKLLMQIVKRYSSKKPFISISLTPKVHQAPAPVDAPAGGDFDDDIPF
jgi:hypothetical protein